MVDRIYDQLHTVARRSRRRNPQVTLSTTALLNEAWLKLEQGQHQFENELHYLKTAALAMRQILIDHARYRTAECRDRGQDVSIVESRLPDLLANQQMADWLSLDQALSELQKLDSRAADVVQLKFFIGLTFEKIADSLGISVRSVKRDWQRARAFLAHQLSA